MSGLPPASHKYLGPNPVRSQICSDVTDFSKTQVIPSLIMAIGAFLYAYQTGQVTSLGNGIKLVGFSILAGLLFYFVLAVIRAPFIVVGWHLRQLSALSLKLADISALPLEQRAPANSFSGFRVISDEGLRLEFEVWYFYDGALGDENICIYSLLENNGVALGCGQRSDEAVSIIGHQALARMTLTCTPTEGETSIKSTHIALTLEHDEKDVLFYRQLIPYEKIWKAS